jgi:transcriptional regulator with XRE-family HTH domain
MADTRDGHEERGAAVRGVLSFAEARKRAGYTQEQLAEKLNVELTTVGRWERGKSEPQPWMRPRLAKALGLSADELGDIFVDMTRAKGGGGAGEAAVRLANEIKHLRSSAGLSQPQLAMLVGYTRQYISLAERPQRNLPSIELIRALDAGLNAKGALVALRENAKSEQLARREGLVSGLAPAAKLVEAGLTPKKAPAIVELCDALTDYGFHSSELGSTRSGENPPSLQDVKRDLKVAFDAYQQSRFTIAASRVSTLMADAKMVTQTCHSEARGEAFEVLALTYQAAASVLIKVGEPNLAWVAAERGLNAAESAGNPTIRGSLIRSVAFSVLSTGRLEPAMRLIESGAHSLESELNRGKATLSVYGMLFLAGAMAAARFGDGARTADYLSEAHDAAQRLGGDANYLWTAFGTTNVAIHRVNTAAELGDLQTVLDSNLPLGADTVPVERRVRYLLDVARAHSLTGNRDNAFGTILNAERMAPEHVRQHHLTRKIVITLVQNSPGKPGIELDKLTQRMNLIKAT